MKKISAVLITGIFSVLVKVQVFSQSTLPAEKTLVIESNHIAITFYKTTNLVFPYAIKSVDRGSKDILVQKAPGVENILQVKAGKVNFRESNLTVITADGKLYSYELSYADNPSALNFLFEPNPDKISSHPAKSSVNFNEAEIRLNAESVAHEKRTLRGLNDCRYKMRLQLLGLFIKENVMYYSMRIQNNSNIDYDLDMPRFFIRDEKKVTRTASQEIEVQPIYVHGDTSIVKGQSSQTLVFAIPRFTIPDRKYLFIELMERSGGRHLRVKVPNQTILRARALATDFL